MTNRSGFLIQSKFGTAGNYELVVPPSTGEGLIHLWRGNDTAGAPWSSPTRFGSGRVEATTLIQSNFGSIGNLEVVVREGDRLALYWRQDQSPYEWRGPYYIAPGTAVKGTPALIESRFGAQGNFELVVPLAGGKLAHFWRNNDASTLPWIGPTVFGSGNVEAVSLIQSNFGTTGNLEVIAREGERLAHYWRMEEFPFTWFGPDYIAEGFRAEGQPSLIQGNFGQKGNFELVVPVVGGGLAHFWRNNDESGLPWNGPTLFGRDIIVAVSMVQSRTEGNLELVARCGDELVQYTRLNQPPWTWVGPVVIPWSDEIGPSVAVPIGSPSNGLQAALPLYISKGAADLLSNRGSSLLFPEGYRHGSPVCVANKSGSGSARVGTVFHKAPPEYSHLRKNAPFGYFISADSDSKINLYLLLPSSSDSLVAEEERHQGELTRKLAFARRPGGQKRPKSRI